MHASSQASFGPVYLVGAGPGDPRLLSIRAAECLARAHVILCECSVDPRALESASPSSEVVWIDDPRAEGTRRALEEVVARLIATSRAGKTAVHLIAGDPELFSTGFEEAEALHRAGVPVEVVPGVTAATAAAAMAEIPITHAALSSAVAMVTTRQPSDSRVRPVDFFHLGRFPGTLVVYAPDCEPQRWTRRLIEGGSSPDTPVVVVSDAARPHQRVWRCALGELAAQMVERCGGAQSVAVVGPVAALAPAVGWYAARPLFGRRVLLTRPRNQAAEMLARLRDLGADVTVQPAIEIGPPANWQPVDKAIERLDRYHWLVFSSVNGVDFLLGRLEERGHDLRRLAGLKLAAIGPATAERLQHHRLTVATTPPQYRAESLAETLAGHAAGKRFLLARASRGREVLAERLRDAGAEVDQIVVYTSRDVTQPEPATAETLRAGGFDWVTVTSSAIARALHTMYGPALAHSRLASISPITSRTLRELGYDPAVEAKEYTTEGLVDAMVQFQQRCV